MRRKFGNIYLAWRKGAGKRRHIVGVLKQTAIEGVRFSYFKDLDKASEEGFVTYTEFPKTNEIYTKEVLNIFSQRLIKAERADIGDFLRFWEIDEKMLDDKLYLLAHTQGLSPLDNFEFLADFNPVKKLCFVSELAGLTHLQLSPFSVKTGDKLRFEYEPSNEKDIFAIKVFKDTLFIGYIKKVHNKVFHKKNGSKLKIAVKAVDFNGVIKRVFIRISF